mgnify:CR=1 FL=1
MLVINEVLAQEIHDYLVSRPMREVESLVMAVRQLPKFEIPADEVDNKSIEDEQT